MTELVSWDTMVVVTMPEELISILEDAALFGKGMLFTGKGASGKTTLMKIIMGEVQPDSGFVEIGQTVRIGYFAQEIGEEEMKPQQRVIDYIKDVAE